MIILPYEITIEDLRLLVNETQEIQLCSSMFKNKALIKKDGVWTEVPNAVSVSGNIITVVTEACTLNITDQLTIEIDKGDALQETQESVTNIAQAFGITAATEYEPLTDDEVTTEMETIWDYAFNN